MSESNILFVGSDAFAFINFRGELIKSLTGANYNVFAILPPCSVEVDHQIKKLGVNVYYLKLNRRGLSILSDIFYFIEILKILKRIKPKIVVSFFIKPIVYGMLASRLANIPRRIALIEGLGSIYTNGAHTRKFTFRIIKFIVNLLYKIALYHATDVILLNETDKSDLQELKVLTLGKGVVFGPIGVNLAYWSRRSVYPEQITFLMACRLIQEKGVLQFLEASKLLKKSFPNARFILAGGVEYGANAIDIELIHKSVINGDIEWVGHVDIKNWMDLSSVFVLPTYYREGVPRSIQEASAMSMPIITCEVPGCFDVLVPGLTGFFVNPRDPIDLANTMRKFCINPNLVLELGKNSRLLSERMFDVSIFNDKFLELIDHVK